MPCTRTFHCILHTVMTEVVSGSRTTDITVRAKASVWLLLFWCLFAG